MDIGDNMYYKYSTLPHGISINIAFKVALIPEAKGLANYSLLRYQCFTRKGYILFLIHTLSLFLTVLIYLNTIASFWSHRQ